MASFVRIWFMVEIPAGNEEWRHITLNARRQSTCSEASVFQDT